MKNEFKWLAVMYAGAVTLAVTLVFIPSIVGKVKPGFWYLLFCFAFYVVIIGIALVAVARTKWFEVNVGKCLEWTAFWCSFVILGILALPIVLCRSPTKDPYIDWFSALMSFLGHFLLILFSIFFFYRLYYAKHNSIW